MNIHIGPAGQSHYEALKQIELASFETLRAAGAVSGEACASSDEMLDQYRKEDFLLAAFAGGNIPVGFGGGYVIEENLHICELDVHPIWQKKGIGRRIVNALLEAGRARALKGATLTTDRVASFNGPFYASMGFRIVEGTECPAYLRQILDLEEKRGFDPQRRVAMLISL